MHTYKSIVAILIAFAAQMTIHADTVLLTDGTKREGTVVDDDSNSIKLSVKRGPLTATVEIPRKEIARIEIKALAANEDEINFQLLDKEAERLAKLDAQQGAQAWLRYAKFCEDKVGYSGYAKVGYKKAIELDPNLAEARLALGYRLTDSGWQKPQQPTEETITVGPRYVPPQPAFRPATNIAAIAAAAIPDDSYDTSLSSRSNYSRNTYCTSEYGYGANPVIYLGSVNGRLQPVSANQFWYGNKFGYRDSTSNYSNCSTNSSFQSGRTGFYSDGYYRSNSYGVSAYVSGHFGSTQFRGSINGGSTFSGSTGFTSGPGFYFRR